MDKGKDNFLTLVLKGVGMGAANVIPGVSGGTIAFITGIYERFVGSINNFDTTAVKLLFSGKFREAWKHIDGNFLAAILAGVVIATFSLAKLMLLLLSSYALQTWAFFFGLIVASAILMLRDQKNWKAVDILWLIIGGALGVVVCTLTPVNTPDSLWFIFICGAISICAMVLPGISGSFILLVMGKYEYIMQSITGVLHLDPHSILILAVFAVGAAVGILAFAKLLHFLLKRWNRQTILVLTGFVLGSLVKIWPWSHNEAGNDSHILSTILWCIAGIAIVLVLEWAGTKKKKN